MKIVILGCGRVGAHLARLLEAEGHEVTVVDEDANSFKALAGKPPFKGRMVLGKAIDEETLVEARLKEADAFGAVTDEDNTNLMAGLIAKEIFGVERVVCRVGDPKREDVFRTLGMEPICPTTTGAERIRNLILSERISQHMLLADDQHMLVEVAIGPSLAGTKLWDVDLPKHCLLLAVLRSGEAFIPHAELVLERGDTAVVFTDRDMSDVVKQTLAV